MKVKVQQFIAGLAIIHKMRWPRGWKLLSPLFIFAFSLPFVVALFWDAHAFLPSKNVIRKTISPSRGHSRNESTIIFLAIGNRDPNEGLNIAVVGAGPSGLLLSYLMLKDGNQRRGNNQITLFDGRSDPRTNKLEGRAYALGIGIRGRTAIRTACLALWETVKSRGYESERFKLHIGISDTKDLVIPLRSDSKPSKDSSSSIVEPSLLIYQSELCASLLEKLEELDEGLTKNKNNGLEIHFDTRVVDCDLDTMSIRALPSNGRNTTLDASAAGGAISEFGPFDLIVGCDGVNSMVRASIDQSFPEFATTKKILPGFFKVVRLGYPVGRTSEYGSNAYDPKAVSLLIPSGAFIEPTGDDGSCCILLSGRGSGDADRSGLPLYLTETKNIAAVTGALRTAFPRWKDESFRDIAKQLLAQDLSSNSAFSVTCNIYHYRDKAVLVGDAAHATGGVSGQGVNSALVDAVVLAESLQPDHKGLADLEDSLLDYSMRQVPEGRALYDLSFGPKPNGLKKKILWSLKNARDALFRGRLGIGEESLQTRLSSELTSFAELRRERDYFYKNGDDNQKEHEEIQSSFPSDDEFRMQLKALHNIQKEHNESEGKIYRKRSN